MAVWNLNNDGEANAIQTLTNESDRGAAIIAGTFVEDRLTQGLTCCFRRDTAVARKLVDDLTGINGALGAFATKIKLGFLIRLYGRQVFNELTAIKDIRNQFAHILGKSAALSFQSPEIIVLCNKLKIIENYVRPMSEFKFTIGGSDSIESTRRSGMSFSDNPPPSDTLGNPRRRYTETCGLLSERFQTPDAPRDPSLPDEFLILGDEQYPLP
jgi:hypothetical protein